jgi:hypothetical protein
MIFKFPHLLLLPVLVFTSTLANGILCQRTDAQTVVAGAPYRIPERVYWGAYDPYYSITARVYAQADLIRAQGDAAIGYATARNLNAEAYSQELDNWQKEVRVYWDRKIIAEQKELELGHVKQIARMKYLNDRKWQNSREWDRLKNHPELSATRIASGSALNFLLSRLAASSLPYKFDSSSSLYSREALNELPLDKDWFRHIKLKQGAFTFNANQPVQKEINFWPYLLRWEEFDVARTAFEKARVVAVAEAESKGQVSVAAIQKMQHELMSLTNKFHSSSSVDQWIKKHRRYSQFVSSDRFLRELDREIVRVEKTGDIRPFRGQNSFDPVSDGDHLIGLLCYINRNGIEFAPADPGSEFAYHNLFVLMRSVYLTVAESDQSIQPKNLGEIAK